MLKKDINIEIFCNKKLLLWNHTLGETKNKIIETMHYIAENWIVTTTKLTKPTLIFDTNTMYAFNLYMTPTKIMMTDMQMYLDYEQFPHKARTKTIILDERTRVLVIKNTISFKTKQLFSFKTIDTSLFLTSKFTIFKNRLKFR